MAPSRGGFLVLMELHRGRGGGGCGGGREQKPTPEADTEAQAVQVGRVSGGGKRQDK